VKKLLITLIALLLVTFGTSSAQLKYGTIDGKVIDNEGMPLPGVTVTLESEMVPTRTTTTSNKGEFAFRSLDPGTYKLIFDLLGFKKEVREQIKIVVGKTLTFNITMSLATIEEEVTVTAQSPIVDTKKTGTAVNITQEVLANVPSARDPWVILEQTAGVLVDRVNVGGSQSGQQSNFVARGDSGTNVMWNLDGLNITDQSALGATPTYWDYDAFEEMQVTTGGADPSIQTGGINLNFVTKRGGNKFRGQAYFYRTDAIPFVSFQAKNVLTSEVAEYFKKNKNWTDEQIIKAYPGDRINRIKDYGFEAGGPIIKDKLWIWGAWGVQDIKMFTVAGTPDDTLLDNINFKINAQFAKNNRAEILYFRGDKLKWGRGAGVTRPAPTTWDQQGPSTVYKFEDEHVFSDNFFVTLRAGYVDIWFELWPKGGGPEVENPPITTLDYDTGYYDANYWYYRTIRPGYHINTSASLFLEDVLGGDHEWKFGAEYRVQSVRTQSGIPGNMLKTYYSGFGWPNNSCAVWLVRPEDFKENYKRISGWVGDTFTVGRLTLNLGARYDWTQNGHADIGEVTDKDSMAYGQWNVTPASYVPIDTYYLPPVRQEGKPDVIKWTNFSPRVGFTYDITGDGKTLLRGNWALYYDQMGSYEAYYGNASAYGETDWYWYDANADNEVSTDELYGYPDPSWCLWVSRSVDLNNPGVYPSLVDPNLSAGKTMEFLGGLEREIFTDFSLSATFIYRKLWNFTWLPIRGRTPDEKYLTGDNWVIGGTLTNSSYKDFYDGNVYQATYYQLPFYRPAGIIYTNRPDYRQTYWGIEVVATKRLSNRWMMNASFNWNDHKQFFDSAKAYQDPGDIKMLNGYQVGYETSGSGKTAIWMNSKWQFKINGLYQLPWGFNVSAFLTARQGFPQPIRLRSGYRPDGTSRAYVQLTPFGERRLPTFWMLDFRIEKVVPIGDYGSIGIIADFFNLTNNNITLGHETILNLSTAWQPREIINPRVFRLGIRFRF